MKQLLLTIAITLLTTVAVADDRQTFSSRHISTSDGLAGNTINELAQDPDGFMWIASNNGLSRYDGYSTVNYTTLGYGEGEVERIGHITCDTTEQRLWISTAIYTNACYDLRKRQFVNWTDEPHRQLNKFFLSSRGMFFYGMSFGARLASQGQVTDYRKENGLLPSNEVVMILEDNRHIVWMPTDKGICALHPDGSTTTLMPDERIIGGATDGEDIFFLTQAGEVVAFDSDLKKKPIARITIPARVNTCFVWQQQMMVFTTDGAYAIDTGNGKVTTLDIANGLNQGECQGYHFIANESGRLWIFPPQGAMQSMLLIPNAHFLSNRGRKFHIAADDAGLFHIATYGNGLFVWNPDDGTTAHYTANDEKPLISSNYLTCALCDQQNNIWLGTEGCGAYCLTKQNGSNSLLMPEPDHKGDWANAISALAIDPADSTVAIGTRWGGIYRYRPDTGSIMKEASLAARIMVLFYDSKGRLWTGTDTEGFYVEGRHYRQGTMPGTLTVNYISTICQDGRGRIWIGTHNGGLFVTDDGDLDHLLFRQYLTEGMNESRIKSLFIDSDERLWVGTNNGIYCTDSRKTDITEADFRCYNRDNGLFPHNEIYTISAGPDATLLIGASGSGMMKCRFPDNGDKPTIERITVREGLPNNNVYSIVCDQQDNIWTGTEGGIARIMLQGNLVRTIGQDDVAAERCALLTPQGTILIGTINGLLVQHLPSPFTLHPSPLTPHPSPAITDLHINGASLMELGRPYEQEFRHDENSLEFYFSDFRYDASSQTLYQYYLEGIEDTWQAPTTNHHADYRDLAPGDYVFHLRTQDSDGEWHEETQYAFTILHPWYLQWWAWIIYLVLIALIAWYLYHNWKEKFDLHQQMKLDRQLMDFRARLFTNITHEFRTPLAIIKGAVDKLDSQQAAVQTARRGTKRLLKLVNQFMEFRKTSTGHLRLRVQQDNIIGFISEIHKDFWPIAQQKDIQITFTPFARDYQVPFDHNIVETIIYNLLSNAVKYTQERGSVTVRMSHDEPSDTLIVTVEDNGPGISEEQQKVLFQPFMNGLASQGGMGIGLYTAHQMASIHKGALTYERTDSGSRFTLTLPANDSPYAADDYLDSQLTTANSPLDQRMPADSGTQELLTTLIREVQPEALNDQTIVIIEDDLDMKEQIQHEIGTYFRTKTFINGKSGYEGVKELQPSLVICDVMLPDMDGYDIVTRLKQESATAQIPIIMLTSLADEKHQIKAYQAGADDFMTKPCNWTLLVARVIQLIKWRQSSPTVEVNSSSSAEANSSSGAEANSCVPSVASDQRSSASLFTLHSSPPKASIITSQADKVFLVKLQMLTAQHISEETFDVDTLAMMMNMGRTKFYGRVKEMTGLSPNKYLLKVRMEKAADLLADGELNVSEVSYKVGIQDPGYFNKLFKSYYGVVPSKYVREAQ